MALSLTRSDACLVTDAYQKYLIVSVKRFGKRKTAIRLINLYITIHYNVRTLRLAFVCNAKFHFQFTRGNATVRND